MYKCLSEETIASKVKNFTEMILTLRPGFIFTSTVLQYFTDEYNFINRKAKKLFHNRTNLNKNLYVVNQKEPETFKETLQMVKNAYFIQNDASFKKFRDWKNRIIIKDYLNQRYITPFTRRIYSFDTRKLANSFELTLLINHGSRKIVVYSITNFPPTAENLVQFLKDTFTKKLIEKCFIIYCDRTGANIYHKFINFVQFELKVILNFTTTKNANHVVENCNQKIKQILTNNVVSKTYGDVPFEDLTFDEQMKVTKAAITFFNTRKTSKSSPELQGYSRENID